MSSVATTISPPSVTVLQIQMKALMAGQTFDLMLGYVQKDCGEPYYNIFVKAVSAQELADGRANYSAVKVSILPYHMLTQYCLYDKMILNLSAVSVR